MKCLITGVNLHDVGSGTFAYGDLHEIGECYVLNAVFEMGKHCNTRWDRIPINPQNKLVVMLNGPSFDRRGVVVMRQRDVIMNDAAKAYVYGDGTVDVLTSTVKRLPDNDYGF